MEPFAFPTGSAFWRMTVDNQIGPPPCFMVMYVPPGGNRSGAPQELVLVGHEQCDDMTCMLTEHARRLAFKENFSGSEVPARCHQGLRDDVSGFDEKQAARVKVLRHLTRDKLRADSTPYWVSLPDCCSLSA